MLFRCYLAVLSLIAVVAALPIVEPELAVRDVASSKRGSDSNRDWRRGSDSNRDWRRGSDTNRDWKRDSSSNRDW
ncbi:hypothetical protein B0H16DRAFT_1708103 [Mycena metata]|uniref:Uncharacterized protein n=1 Tax=Mycena metata TaxID=1033252 RepID=A0AAD7P356_9AGAR|nr:hypothetical protein B0H16DRAFT_1708103 [Mycena metata]